MAWIIERIRDWREERISVEPEDLPEATLPTILSADDVAYDPDTEIVEADGEKYYLPRELHEQITSTDEE